ncbi:leukocyte cell-derived chemotaxin-2-like [Cololabis saira]|uniref:leukocyte cell-derived chemotaxin-2-like n=1 Tax=Cololabis saira TaxID=129043 RepID=UPI002AD5603C|nr:leukocyte cell-derived chemotaxin-2-like [Cololabis saira]
MRMLIKVCLIAMLLLCYVQLGLGSELSESEDLLSSDKSSGSSSSKARGGHAPSHDRRPEPGSPRKKLKKTGSGRVSAGEREDESCTRMGGICQPRRYICQGRYLKDKCSDSKLQQCCLQAGAWSVLCAGHHKNRVRACDAHGCGAFSSERDSFHGAVDLVCDDYSVINAPFSGSLAGPVSRKDQAGHQYDGVKLQSDVYCVKIFNIRPYRYFGPVARGEALGYLLPLQECFSGITSHLELQMCDGSDPSSFM